MNAGLTGRNAADGIVVAIGHLRRSQQRSGAWRDGASRLVCYAVRLITSSQGYHAAVTAAGSIAATLSAWPFRVESVTPLAGGWNSTTWLVGTGEKRYVARLVDDFDAPGLVSDLQVAEFLPAAGPPWYRDPTFHLRASRRNAHADLGQPITAGVCALRLVEDQSHCVCRPSGRLSFLPILRSTSVCRQLDSS